MSLFSTVVLRGKGVHTCVCVCYAQKRKPMQRRIEKREKWDKPEIIEEVIS